MILLIDAGNSRIKWAAWDGPRPAPRALDRRGPDWLAAVPARPDRVLVSSVAGAAFDADLAAGVQARWGLAAEFARPRAARGPVRNGYDDPARLGVDRWLAVLAAFARWPGGACVVDAGTALTVDLVDAHGVHCGGYIAPGLALMRASLAERTGLPAPAGVEAGPGRDTRRAIAAGTVAAAAGLVDRALAVLRCTTPGARLVLTGGDAAALAPLLPDAGPPCPGLVLEGLLIDAGLGPAPLPAG